MDGIHQLYLYLCSVTLENILSNMSVLKRHLLTVFITFIYKRHSLKELSSSILFDTYYFFWLHFLLLWLSLISLLLLALLKVLEPSVSLLTQGICVFSVLCLQCSFSRYPHAWVCSSLPSLPAMCSLIGQAFHYGITDLAQLVIFSLIYFSP